MKHAALIMAHKSKSTLIRLIKKVSCNSIDIFVHLDKKWSLSIEDISEVKNAAPNVYISAVRLSGALDQWSLPEISLLLAKEALQHENESCRYCYFLLLSGQDYPIKPINYILDFLERQYPKPLIDIEPYKKENWVSTKFLAVKWLHKIEDIHAQMQPGLRRKMRVAPLVIADKISLFFCGTPYDRLSKLGVKIYGGSAWWILPREVIDFIFQSFKTRPEVIEAIKESWTSEETFFQIMTMLSPMAKYIQGNDPIYDSGNQQCMTYANFVTPTKPFRGHPHDITPEDIDRIVILKALFARKFNFDINENLADLIDQKLEKHHVHS